MAKATNGAKENPYLAHLPPDQRYTDSSTRPPRHVKERLYGFLPRSVKGEQVRRALEGDLNPFTKQPLSVSYKKILERFVANAGASAIANSRPSG